MIQVLKNILSSVPGTLNTLNRSTIIQGQTRVGARLPGASRSIVWPSAELSNSGASSFSAAHIPLGDCHREIHISSLHLLVNFFRPKFEGISDVFNFDQRLGRPGWSSRAEDLFASSQRLGPRKGAREYAWRRWHRTSWKARCGLSGGERRLLRAESAKCKLLRLRWLESGIRSRPPEAEA